MARAYGLARGRRRCARSRSRRPRSSASPTAWARSRAGKDANLVARDRRHHGHAHAGDARLHRRRPAVAGDAPHAALRALQGPAVKRPFALGAARSARARGAPRERPALPVGLPAGGVQGALGGRLRQDRGRSRRRRPGRPAHERLPAAAPDELDLLPVGHRDAARLPAARRPQPKGHALPAAAQRAARALGRQGALGRRRRARQAPDRRRRSALDRGDGRALADRRRAAASRSTPRARPPRATRESRYELQARDAAIANDFWDGRTSRERRFVELLRTRHPRATIQDLTPILDELRSVKSPREIALIRRASQLAGLGVMEAARSTEPGVYEYQLDAAVPLRVPDERRAARRLPLDHRLGHRQHLERALLQNSRKLEGGRPGADGLRARLPLLRERHRADVAGRRPLPARAARAAAVRARVPQRRDVADPARGSRPTRSAPRRSRRWTRSSHARTSRSPPTRRRRASSSRRAAASSRTRSAWRCTTSAATAACSSPARCSRSTRSCWVPEENLYFRYEDTVVVTETGVENFTAFLPTELDALEALAREKGIVQTLPALGEAGSS